MMLFARTLLFCGPTDQVAAARPEHEQQLQELDSAGKLHFAGSLGTADDEEGLFEVILVEDRHEAERWTRGSALVQGGLVSWTLRRWLDRGESS